MTNDTEVFYALRFDSEAADYVSMGSPRMGTRDAINRSGRKIDPLSQAFCPHQWIGADGFVDLALAQQHPYPRRRF